ncbi:MAG: hypothetical protein PVSMB2_37770 [Ktedonobacteraceae bacterium]
MPASAKGTNAKNVSLTPFAKKVSGSQASNLYALEIERMYQVSGRNENV